MTCIADTKLELPKDLPPNFYFLVYIHPMENHWGEKYESIVLELRRRRRFWFPKVLQRGHVCRPETDLKIIKETTERSMRRLLHDTLAAMEAERKRRARNKQLHHYILGRHP